MDKLGLKMAKLVLKMAMSGIKVAKLGLTMAKLRLKMAKLGLKMAKLRLKLAKFGFKMAKLELKAIVDLGKSKHSELFKPHFYKQNFFKPRALRVLLGPPKGP